MKASTNTLESLSDITRVETSGDMRRIAGQMLLALVRKEISATDVEAGAKIVAAAAQTWATEIKLHKVAAELRERAADLGKLPALGKLPLGGTAEFGKQD